MRKSKNNALGCSCDLKTYAQDNKLDYTIWHLRKLNLLIKLDYIAVFLILNKVLVERKKISSF